ncbi:unnamed protein product [Cyberlindnera jadinii]|uniref:Uncharacterized protein n=1 Tax=Cyberlindnera jadinii (strain ATCC 18201 / CBS 1600 / BCRC 20928 / JCM 3617 / NBRC 0987 / NRRL Y-1542) TaxID=983966 RepID=A0A0H5CD25_CYBJN|nr:hypothetical protein CYBJADRAFT_188512 [Cyberlindnera jadinii NRRL Y-1542]ODV75385.1 hypothetical protein CYBJADRAFT_188512 [Cyberlindnera jadinii NRRL Y-1542]CEP22529.1 unnamed protein product [Cyberlindnera jadinii]
MIPSQQYGYDYSFQQKQTQITPQQQSQQGYLYNNSPLANNAMLNGGYNNLNLSRGLNPGAGSSGSVSAVGTVGAALQSYPTPRSNGSPSLNFASLYSNRNRLSASKGFELEDDLEFCPEIQYSPSQQSYTHHKFNPYTSTSFSPTVSPTSQNATTNSPKTITPRAKKVLEIVNPVTGLRVGSPNPYK